MVLAKLFSFFGLASRECHVSMWMLFRHAALFLTRSRQDVAAQASRVSASSKLWASEFRHFGNWGYYSFKGLRFVVVRS